MSRQMTSLIILLVCTAVVGALGFMNTAAQATLQLGGQVIATSAGVLLMLGYGVGVVAALGLSLAKFKTQQASTKQLEQWQVQDAKLAAQVQTDREKQLEAKIATLEAALDRALKSK